jgi:peptide/nickel transport system permease protein
MLRYALRRALWMLPTLVATTLVAFWFLSRMPGEVSSAQLPLFVNPSPRDVRSLAESSVDELAREVEADGARDRLVILGGAALPFVLPRLESLGAGHRTRVALALEPVAARMGLLRSGRFSDGNEAVVFWERFWEEREVDFKPSVVRRAVRRMSASGSDARRTELVELDTFALDTLMDELGEVRTEQDVTRVRHLIDIASHVTGRADRIEKDSSPQLASRCVTRWRGWWLDARSDYVVLAGPQRLAAMLLDTRYGRWAMGAVSLRLGMGPRGTPVLYPLVHRGPITLAMCWLAQLMAYATAIVAGLLGAWYKKRPVGRVPGMAIVALYGFTPALACAAIASVGGLRFAFASACVATCVGLAAPAARQQRVAALDALSDECVRAARARGVRTVRLMARHVLRLTGTRIVALAAIDFPAAFTASCVAERVLGVRGLSWNVTEAVATGNVAFLMAFGVCCWAITSLMIVAGDLVMAWVDPRCRPILLKGPS